MNLLQLRDLTRNRLDDKTEPYLWSDEDLNSYINQAINEAAIRSKCIIDSTTNDCCKIEVLSNVSNYALNPAIFQIKRVFDETNIKTLVKESFERMDDLNEKWQQLTGMPSHYLCDLDSNIITLYPIPTENLVLRLTVARTPLNELINDNDITEIPVFYHADLAWWCMYLAYSEQDADKLNIEKALSCEEKFTQIFGVKPEAKQIEWRKKYAVGRIPGQYF